MENKFTDVLFPIRKKLLMTMMRTFIFLCCAAAFGFTPKLGFSQNDKIAIDADKTLSVDQIFDLIKTQTDYTFIYKSDLFKNTPRVRLKKGSIKAKKLLDKSLSKSEFSYVFTTDNTILVKRKSKAVSIPISIQEKTVNGIITDTTGIPLAGANILEKGTTNGIQTDFDGNFTITVTDESAVLVISYIGYTTKEVPLNGSEPLSIQLQVDASNLDEVVVVGYGIQKIKDVTGAVKRITNEDFNKGVVTNAGELIKGKASGVNITSSSGEPGSGQRIIIRGQGTLRAGSGPLFVLDGFPLGLAGTGSGGSPLNFINAEDIETIDVLKDASATAIYGSRGANGVVIITTKKGKAGRSKVSFSSSVGVSTLARKLDVFSADEFRKEVAAIPGNELIDGGGSTDWQEELTRAAITQNYNLVLSGGTDKLSYYASLGQQDQEGIVYNSDLKRTSARINVTQKALNGRLKVDYNVNTTVTEQSRNNNLGYTTNPTFDAYTADGKINNPVIWNNPLLHNKYVGDFSESRRFLMNIAPSFEIIDGLIYKMNVGYENRSSDRDQQTIANTDRNDLGNLTQTFGKYKNTLIENYLTYSFNIEEHNLSILGGHSYQKTFYKQSSWSIDDFPSDTGIEPRYNPGLGGELDISDNNRPSGSAWENELQSFFGRANWNYKGKYMLTATVRADGSSKFGGNNKYGVFSSFAGSWRLIDEDFMADSSIFSDLKLRAGWGQTGNQEIPNKITQESFTVSNSSNVSYPIDPNGPYPVGSDYTRFANPDIQWEVSTQSNIGVDFGLFDGSLTGTIDYFYKVSDNILLEVVPVDPIVPAPTYWTNVPDMVIINKGFEVALDYSVRNEDGFSYGIGGNATFIDNVVEDSPFTIVTTGSASGQGLTDATINGFVSGQPLGSFYMQTFTGIDGDGLSQFADNDGDGEITEKDRTVVGSALPDLTYNFYTNFSYKRFDLNMNFNGVSGNEIYDHTAMGSFYKTLLSKSNNTTAIATEFTDESIINAAAVSTRYLKDGSFLRLNNLTIGYSFDTDSMAWASKWLKELRLNFTGQNLFVITDYDGYDPEVNQDASTGGIQSFGIDKFAYPKAKTFVLGLNVTF